MLGSLRDNTYLFTNEYTLGNIVELKLNELQRQLLATVLNYYIPAAAGHVEDVELEALEQIKDQLEDGEQVEDDN